MDTKQSFTWIRTAVISGLAGGIMAALAAACDPTKYKFPADLGSGKLWPFFLGGAAAMFGGALLRSPIGTSAMQAYKDAQAQMIEDKAALEKAREELKPPSGPPLK